MALFLAMQTQWNWTGGVRVGLNYLAIKPTADAYDIAVDATVMTELSIMEMAAIDAFAEIARRETRR